MSSPTATPNDAPLTRCDRFNAQLMRRRLRRDYGIHVVDAETRLLELIAESGEIRPPFGTYMPRSAGDEEFEKAIGLDLIVAVREDRLLTFTERYLSLAVRYFINRHHQSHRGASLLGDWDDELFEEGEHAAFADALDATERQEALYATLNKDEAYFLGWYLAVGKPQGEQRQAARAIGRSDAWATGVWKGVVAKAQGLRDGQGPARGVSYFGDRDGGVFEDDEGGAVDAALDSGERQKALYLVLEKDEAYVLGWYLAVGKRRGERRQAARAIGRPDDWASEVWKQMEEKASGLSDRQGP